MRISILFLIAPAAILAAGSQAQAQSFTGPRIEATAGYDSIHGDDGVAATRDTLDGPRVGAAVGYDLPIGSRFTIGAEAGIGWQIDGSLNNTVGTPSTRATSGYDMDFSVRLGAKATPSTLLFVKAGYADSEYRVRSATGTTVTRVKDDNDAYRLGVGVEQALGRHFYAKAEYRFSDYGDDVQRHQVLAGLGYRF